MALGVDVGSYAIKMIALKRKLGGYSIVGAVRRNIWEIRDDQARIARRLGNATKRYKGGKFVYTSLNGKDLNLQLSQLPPVKPHILRAMMKYEMEQKTGNVGGIAGDLYGEYTILKKPDKLYQNYLCLIGLVRREFLDRHIKALEDAQLKFGQAIPASIALFNVYKNGESNAKGNILLMDTGAESVNFALVKDGELILARNVTRGANIFTEAISGMLNISITKAEALKIGKGSLKEGEAQNEGLKGALRSAAAEFSGLIQSSLTFARTQLKEPNLKMDKILISGGGAKLGGIKEYLTSAAGVAVEYLDPYQNVDFNGIETISMLPTDMAISLGLAQMQASRLSAVSLSILPTAVKQKRMFWKSTLFRWASAALIVIVVGFMTYFAKLNNTDKERALRDFEDRTTATKENITKYKGLEEKFASANEKMKFLVTKVNVSQALISLVNKLSNSLPKEAWVSSVETQVGDKGDLVLAVSGYIEQNVKEGVDKVLKDLEAKLTMPESGFKAQVSNIIQAPDEVGAMYFTILLKPIS